MYIARNIKHRFGSLNAVVRLKAAAHSSRPLGSIRPMLALYDRQKLMTLRKHSKWPLESSRMNNNVQRFIRLTMVDVKPCVCTRHCAIRDTGLKYASAEFCSPYILDRRRLHDPLRMLTAYVLVEGFHTIEEFGAFPFTKHTQSSLDGGRMGAQDAIGTFGALFYPAKNLLAKLAVTIHTVDVHSEAALLTFSAMCLRLQARTTHNCVIQRIVFPSYSHRHPQACPIGLPFSIARTRVFREFEGRHFVLSVLGPIFTRSPATTSQWRQYKGFF